MRNYNSVGCNYLSQTSACQMTLSRRLRAITAPRLSCPGGVRRGQLLWREQAIWSLPATLGHLSGPRGASSVVNLQGTRHLKDSFLSFSTEMTLLCVESVYFEN